MDSLKAVDEIWMLTSGGPGVETRLAGIHIWRSVFESRFYGYGSAMSIFLLYITIVICWFLYVIMTSKQNQSNDLKFNKNSKIYHLEHSFDDNDYSNLLDDRCFNKKSS